LNSCSPDDVFLSALSPTTRPVGRLQKTCLVRMGRGTRCEHVRACESHRAFPRRGPTRHSTHARAFEPLQLCAPPISPHRQPLVGDRTKPGCGSSASILGKWSNEWVALPTTHTDAARPFLRCIRATPHSYLVHLNPADASEPCHVCWPGWLSQYM
jgi:hypothetical protein